ncbi:hypothetical protein DES38_1023 [Streptohalobacillus salinus]|uniref:Uncharacterized protein n=1 Tax=Streptohalobacillus salinus TaxID=621096 RepID=A0A2V3WE38_9BACI|nr:DUF6544 family protein [Streptohalobacillus salinus]PXW92425.1 hypothetical protein DES38_1023 [Streptohalobacillus salinus]
MKPLISYGLFITGFVIIILFLISLSNQKKFEAMVKEEKAQLLNETVTERRPVIDETKLEQLPPIVKQWLINTGIIGKPFIRTVELKQTGTMKLKPNQEKPYYPVAEQVINVTEPGYLWSVDLQMMPVISTTGRDYFYRGNGEMLIRLGHLFAVVDEQQNEKINESSMHRFLLELPWYPTAALETYMNWTAVDDETAEATLNYNGQTVSAIFHFNTDAELEYVEAMRYKDTGPEAERQRCFGEINSYTTVDGLRIPNQIAITWDLEGELFTWYELNAEAFQFDYIEPGM